MYVDQFIALKQDSYDAKVHKSETADHIMISPAAKKMKSDDKLEENDGSLELVYSKSKSDQIYIREKLLSIWDELAIWDE